MIDVHCHIDLYPKPQEIVQKCHDFKIFVVAVTTTPSAFEFTKSICDKSDFVKTALGLHPQLAVERKHELDLFDSLIKNVLLIGEVGLDGSPELSASWRKQEDVFRHILDSCTRMGGRIISVHSKRASEQVLDLLRKFPDCGIPILHWFSGPVKDLRIAIEMGCWFSIGPAMMNSRHGLRICEEIPKNRVLTESDGPFVSINERFVSPWDVQIAENGLSSIWRQPNEETRLQLNQNKEQIFKLIS